MDNERDGFNRYENTIGPDNASDLQLAWSYPKPVCSDSPTVARGVLYVCARRFVVLKASSGALLWHIRRNALLGFYSSAAVVNGVVYVSSLNDRIYALDAATGSTIWSYKTGDWIAAPPVVVDGVVYVGSYDHTFYALNASTGGVVWSYETGGVIFSSAAVADGVVYFKSADSTLYALDASTGSFRWSQPVGAIYSAPVVADGAVYIGGAAISAFNASTGAPLWSFDTGGEVASEPAVAHDVVYTMSSNPFSFSSTNYMYALNAATGALIWSHQTGHHGSISIPAVANGVVYVGSRNQNLYALDASTGERLWSYATDGEVLSPAVVNGVVYVGTQPLDEAAGGTLYAFDLPKGKSAVARPDPGTLYPTPSI